MAGEKKNKSEKPQWAEGGKKKGQKLMDEPGIEPGTFRMLNPKIYAKRALYQLSHTPWDMLLKPLIQIASLVRIRQCDPGKVQMQQPLLRA